MIKQPNMKMIGAFITVSCLISLLLVGYSLKSSFKNYDIPVVMYFDESVQGLDVGAPVLFKGVKVGEVTSVKIISNLDTMQFQIPVYAKIYNDESLSEGAKDERERLDILIKDGLRARLAVNSMITGQLLIELDLFPKTEAVLHEYARNEFEIPTIDSPFAEFSKTLQVMPITKIAQDIHNITQALDKQLPPLLQRMNSTLAAFDSILNENKNNTSQMVQQFSAAAQSFDNMVDENAAGVSAMIESFSAAAQSMKNLTDYLQMNPSAIITGKDY